MKKSIFSLFALAAILFASCNKEQEAPVVPESAGRHAVSIKASITPGTRTSYENDKTFSWKAGDVIQVMTISADESYLRLEDFTAESDGPETIFSGEVEDGYTLYGNAFYTAKESYVAFGGEGDSNFYLNFPSFTYIDGDSETYYTVDSANPLENLPLIGFKGEEDDTYVFQTAAGAAKFTFEDIPEGAEYVAIEGSANYLSGQFAFDETGVLKMENNRPGSYTYTDSEGTERTANYASRYVVYHFERNADGTATIYMPLPVGEIPAGATVDFFDAELENILYSRTIRGAIPISRNKVTEVASFSAAPSDNWEDIGTGAYYDLLPFYYMNSDVNTFVGVEFYKNADMPGVYRIENPYPLAAEDRGYTIPSDYELPEYLEFTILKDNTVIYDDIHTGYTDEEDSATYGDWFGGCPASWGEDNSFNFVAKYHEDGTPDLVVLSPLYLYQANGGYYYAYSSTTWKNMWVTMYFPGADLENQYDLYCTVELTEVSDDNPAQPLGSVELDLGESYAGAYLVIAKDKASAAAMFDAGLGVQVSETGTYDAPFPADAPSGEYFAFAKTIPLEGFTENCALIFDSDEEFDYFRSDEDRQLTIDDIAGSYTGNNYYRTSSAGWTASPVDMTLAIEESDDPLSGYDIMFTSLCPEIANAIAGRAGSATPQPVYASFDTAHGIVTIPAGQIAYTIKQRTQTYNLTTGDVSGEDIVLFLKEDGSLQNKKNIGFFNGTDLAGNTNRNTVFYRGGKSNAPARMATRKRSSLRPIGKTYVENISLYPGLDMGPVERVPFTGNRAKVGR